MAETRVSEPKLVNGIKVRKVTRNRKSYGEIHYHDATVIYWTKRRGDELHRLSNSWMVECDTIAAIKLYGVTHVGVIADDGVRFLTAIAVFSPQGIEQGALRQRSNSYIDPFGRRGALCWHIPLALWARSELPEEMRHQTILEQMRIKRGRVSRSVQ